MFHKVKEVTALADYRLCVLQRFTMLSRYFRSGLYLRS